MIDIPPEVRELIFKRRLSMDHIEVLMRLRETAERPMTLAELDSKTRLGPETTASAAADLVDAGLVKHDTSSGSYSYGARGLDRAAVDALSVMYHQRPVTLVRLVYEQPPSPVKSFAEAFRFRDNSDA